MTAEERAQDDANRAAEEAMTHARHLRPVGNHNFWVKGLQSQGQLAALTFTLPQDEFKAAEFVRELDSKGNLFIAVNEVSADLGPTRGSKADLISLSALHVDLDPEDGIPLAEWRAATLAKTDALPLTGLVGLLVDSGSGFHLYFLLAEKLPATTENIRLVKAFNRALVEYFDGDTKACDPTRILRLAGTLNAPDGAKRAKGRRSARSAIIRQSDVKVTLEQMRQFVEPIFEAETTASSAREQELITEINREGHDEADDFPDLPADLREKFLDDLDNGRWLRRLWEEGKAEGDRSGSGHLASLAQALGRISQSSPGRYSVVDFARLAWVWPFSVQAGNDREDKLDARQLARAWMNVTETVEVRDEAKQAAAYEILEPETNPTNDGQVDDGAGLEISEAGDNAGAPASPPLAAEAKPPRIPFLRFADLAATALSSSAPYLVKGLLDQGAFGLTYGPSNVGKSFVVLDIAFHVSAGLPWGGMKVQQGTVIYVAAEGGAGVRKRVAALCRRYGRDDVDLQFILSNIDLRRPDADVGPLIAAIEALGRPIILLVIDTLSRVMSGGDENSSVDMGALVKNIDRIRTATGSAVLAVHHSGRDASKGARGHSLLRAAVDTEIEIADRTIVVTKQRDIDMSWTSGFDLPVVTLGTDEDGAPITSCVLELVPKNDRSPETATPSEQAVLDSLTDILSDAPSRGARAAEIVGYLKGSDRNLTLSGVRGHLKNLAKKGLVAKAGVDQWRPKAAKMTSATWFQDIVEPTPEPEVVAEHVAEGVFE